MKKVLCTGLTALLIFGGSTMVFAADTPATTTGGAVTTSSAISIVPDMNFTGTPVQLSLKEAYKKMLADSPGAKLAELNKMSAEGVATGYSESASKLGNRAAKESGDYDPANAAMAIANREFAAVQASRNYEAELNKLKTDTFKNYYTLKELESQEKLAKDNLALKEKLLSNTKLKYKVGTVSKNDVLKAEIAVNEASDQFTAAQNGLKTMSMSFHQFMGYSLMQNVTLTDTIEEVPLPKKTLVSSVTDALANRNEIREAAFNLQIANLNFKTVTAYPKSSSKYLNAQIGVLMAETSVKNAPLTIENDVRTKYIEMNEKYAAIQSSKKSIENAQETVRLAQLQYDAGLSTMTEVNTAQHSLYTVLQSHSKALLEYNLAIDAYNLSSGVGTGAANIK